MSFLVPRQCRWCFCLWAGLIKTEGEWAFLVAPWQLVLHPRTPLYRYSLTFLPRRSQPQKCVATDRNRFELCPATSRHCRSLHQVRATLAGRPPRGQEAPPSRTDGTGWMWIRPPPHQLSTWTLNVSQGLMICLNYSWLSSCAIRPRKLTFSLIEILRKKKKEIVHCFLLRNLAQQLFFLSPCILFIASTATESSPREMRKHFFSN